MLSLEERNDLISKFYPNFNKDAQQDHEYPILGKIFETHYNTSQNTIGVFRIDQLEKQLAKYVYQFEEFGLKVIDLFFTKENYVEFIFNLSKVNFLDILEELKNYFVRGIRVNMESVILYCQDLLSILQSVVPDSLALLKNWVANGVSLFVWLAKSLITSVLDWVTPIIQKLIGYLIGVDQIRLTHFFNKMLYPLQTFADGFSGAAKKDAPEMYWEFPMVETLVIEDEDGNYVPLVQSLVTWSEGVMIFADLDGFYGYLRETASPFQDILTKRYVKYVWNRLEIIYRSLVNAQFRTLSLVDQEALKSLNPSVDFSTPQTTYLTMIKTCKKFVYDRQFYVASLQAFVAYAQRICLADMRRKKEIPTVVLDGPQVSPLSLSHLFMDPFRKKFKLLKDVLNVIPDEEFSQALTEDFSLLLRFLKQGKLDLLQMTQQGRIALLTKKGILLEYNRFLKFVLETIHPWTVPSSTATSFSSFENEGRIGNPYQMIPSSSSSSTQQFIYDFNNMGLLSDAVRTNIYHFKQDWEPQFRELMENKMSPLLLNDTVLIQDPKIFSSKVYSEFIQGAVVDYFHFLTSRLKSIFNALPGSKGKTFIDANDEDRTKSATVFLYDFANKTFNEIYFFVTNAIRYIDLYRRESILSDDEYSLKKMPTYAQEYAYALAYDYLQQCKKIPSLFENIMRGVPDGRSMDTMLSEIGEEETVKTMMQSKFIINHVRMFTLSTINLMIEDVNRLLEALYSDILNWNVLQFDDESDAIPETLKRSIFFHFAVLTIYNQKDESTGGKNVLQIMHEQVSNELESIKRVLDETLGLILQVSMASEIQQYDRKLSAMRRWVAGGFGVVIALSALSYFFFQRPPTEQEIIDNQAKLNFQNLVTAGETFENVTITESVAEIRRRIGDFFTNVRDSDRSLVHLNDFYESLNRLISEIKPEQNNMIQDLVNLRDDLANAFRLDTSFRGWIQSFFTRNNYFTSIPGEELWSKLSRVVLKYDLEKLNAMLTQIINENNSYLQSFASSTLSYMTGGLSLISTITKTAESMINPLAKIFEYANLTKQYQTDLRHLAQLTNQTLDSGTLTIVSTLYSFLPIVSNAATSDFMKSIFNPSTLSVFASSTWYTFISQIPWMLIVTAMSTYAVHLWYGKKLQSTTLLSNNLKEMQTLLKNISGQNKSKFDNHPLFREEIVSSVFGVASSVLIYGMIGMGVLMLPAVAYGTLFNTIGTLVGSLTELGIASVGIAVLVLPVVYKITTFFLNSANPGSLLFNVARMLGNSALAQYKNKTPTNVIKTTQIEASKFIKSIISNSSELSNKILGIDPDNMNQTKEFIESITNDLFKMVRERKQFGTTIPLFNDVHRNIMNLSKLVLKKSLENNVLKFDPSYVATVMHLPENKDIPENLLRVKISDDVGNLSIDITSIPKLSLFPSSSSSSSMMNSFSLPITENSDSNPVPSSSSSIDDNSFSSSKENLKLIPSSSGKLSFTDVRRF